MQRIVESACGECWPKVFQNCRSTRQTELARIHPMHVVTSWLGNSEKIANDFYLQVTEEDFARASTPTAPSEYILSSGPSAKRTVKAAVTNPKQNPKQQAAAMYRNQRQRPTQEARNAEGCGTSPPSALTPVPETGLEPARLAAIDPKSIVSANSTTPASVFDNGDSRFRLPNV